MRRQAANLLNAVVLSMGLTHLDGSHLRSCEIPSALDAGTSATYHSAQSASMLPARQGRLCRGSFCCKVSFVAWRHLAQTRDRSSGLVWPMRQICSSSHYKIPQWPLLLASRRETCSWTSRRAAEGRVVRYKRARGRPPNLPCSCPWTAARRLCAGPAFSMS